MVMVQLADAEFTQNVPKSFLSLAALLVTAQIAFASATSDATYIVNQQMNDLAVASLHIKLKRIFQKIYAHQLGKLGVTVVDADRFAAMLPDAVTDNRVRRVRQTLIASYLKYLTQQQLLEIAEFYRTDAAKNCLLPRGPRICGKFPEPRILRCILVELEG